MTHFTEHFGLDHSITELNEFKWTMKFIEAARSTDYIFIEDSTLFIFFNQSSEVMAFKKNKGN
ncbi:MAG: hypothetical protein ISR82_06975 [Candidatus Marinimicrobia bacterium]|nr:hypothetical protein [Candidatus Neomarinimicrobiota bacterium]MBL7010946.1 hypothetical protein [Candidatus Neomarinimicrobiota bacterium]MBL7031283.1 hypothetical protein [Candidatus Neomarinimicrobiota bacterium]